MEEEVVLGGRKEKKEKVEKPAKASKTAKAVKGAASGRNSPKGEGENL